jgi:uncharacterized protein YbaR (Trm112 family)
MTSHEIEEVNNRVAQGKITYLDGRPVRKRLTSGFISCDGRLAYRIEDGIIVLLRNLAVVMEAGELSEFSGERDALRAEKKEVRDF